MDELSLLYDLKAIIKETFKIIIEASKLKGRRPNIALGTHH
jgi:hypothetical protein